LRFFESQRDARSRTRRLLLAFMVTVALLVVSVNLALILAWGLTWGFWVPGDFSLPRHFVAVNTGMTLLFVLGGWWVEASRLSSAGGVSVARQMGAREVQPSGRPEEQRFANIVQEMAIASGLVPPAAMVVARDPGINAFATGWRPEDGVVAVTQGALDHLTREELQGLVAHEFSHIVEGDTRMNLRLSGMVFGLEMIYRLGQRLLEPDDRGQHNAASLIGLALMVAGWMGWIAGHALQAAVARQREFLADARAVQWTRSRDSLGGVLRKVLAQHRAGVVSRPVESTLQHLLLVGNEPGAVAHWLDSHPTLEQRIRRIYGRNLGPLPLQRSPETAPGSTPDPAARAGVRA
jgi:heat shock protein HtpX